MTTPGPNGCTCGSNGDCNCPFVPSAASNEVCGHGLAADEWCETCDGRDEPDDADETCTCSRSRQDLADGSGFPCDCCGRMVR